MRVCGEERERGGVEGMKNSGVAGSRWSNVLQQKIGSANHREQAGTQSGWCAWRSPTALNSNRNKSVLFPPVRQPAVKCYGEVWTNLYPVTNINDAFKQTILLKAQQMFCVMRLFSPTLTVFLIFCSMETFWLVTNEDFWFGDQMLRRYGIVGIVRLWSTLETLDKWLTFKNVCVGSWKVRV